MVAPARLPRNIYIPPLKINTDAAKLDNMYINLLGEGGDNLLSEETKWLAVTHKSFDFGRRGFNDRLSFLGKRTLELQADLTLLATSDPKDFVTDGWVDQHGREPFVHPATATAEVLLSKRKGYLTFKKPLARVAAQYGIPDIVRWKPKYVCDPGREV